MTDAGSEFQTEGAAHQKERFAKSVRANGWMSIILSLRMKQHVHTAKNMDMNIYVNQKMYKRSIKHNNAAS